jgi:cytochrome b pre-mRNA-processing protein 3
MFRRPHRERQRTIDRLYGVIVAHARLPIFYIALAVPDTVEGRFDMLVLHVHLVYRRLAGTAEDGRAFGQDLFDHFLRDMDANLREIGIGDLAVPKRMRSMGEAFYGRAAAYDAALARPDDDALADTLLRNIYAGSQQSARAARQLAHYVRQAIAALDAQDPASLFRGEVILPRPAELLS